jgi:hypothetical protein
MTSKEEIDSMNLQIPCSKFCQKEKVSDLNLESETIDHQICEDIPDEFRSIEKINVGDLDVIAPKQARWFINCIQWYLLLFTYFDSDP